MGAVRRCAVAKPAVMLAVAALLVLSAACGSTGDRDAAERRGDEPLEALMADLEGRLDRVIVMLPPPEDPTEPPDLSSPEVDVLGSRLLLRAATPDGPTDLWLVVTRSKRGGPLVECRMAVTDDGSTGMCVDPHGFHVMVGAAVGDSVTDRVTALWQVLHGTGTAVTLMLNGPADVTHYVITTATESVAVIPVEGQALVPLDPACPPHIRLEMWRGDERLQEEEPPLCT